MQEHSSFLSRACIAAALARAIHYPTDPTSHGDDFYLERPAGGSHGAPTDAGAAVKPQTELIQIIVPCIKAELTKILSFDPLTDLNSILRKRVTYREKRPSGEELVGGGPRPRLSTHTKV